MDDQQREVRIQPGQKRRLIAVKASARNTTAAQRRRFFAELAASCNVKHACAVAGISKSTAYRLRNDGGGFAEAWQQALEAGYVRLEMALIERALATVEGDGAGGGADASAPDGDADGGVAVAAMTVAQAIALLGKHRASVVEGRPRGVAQPARRSARAEDTDAAIIQRIARIRRQRGLPELVDRSGEAA